MLADSQSAGPSIPLVQINPPAPEEYPWLHRRGWQVALIASALVVLGILVWQAVYAKGSPDPTTTGTSKIAAVVEAGILVFREGLEAILVLAALTASLARTEEGYWKPVALGASMSFMATVITWFIVVAIIAGVANNMPEYDIQAATGLLAVVVLLVIMNWFFHKIYWTGWITHHNRRKRALTENPQRSREIIFRGLVLIGFTSVYREGFEVVLFLQTLRLQAGHVIIWGVLIGLALTTIVAVLTFALHYRLPYKRMLVLTGIMLGGVLMVMVGETITEMQQANWLPDGNIATHLPHWLAAIIGTSPAWLNWPDWMNTWFSIYPDWFSLSAQVASVAFVVGSFYLARRVCATRSDPKLAAIAEPCIVPDCNNCPVAEGNPCDVHPESASK
ncbi:MAG TPA: FTR1 family protein [Tepidisphaeraceae bacterium]|nr:FTR1 family protein [Tepidisphaeraceae bacterium]